MNKLMKKTILVISLIAILPVQAIDYYLWSGLASYAVGLGGYLCFRKKSNSLWENASKKTDEARENYLGASSQAQVDQDPDSSDHAHASLQNYSERVGDLRAANSQIKNNKSHYWASVGCGIFGLGIGTWLLCNAKVLHTYGIR